MYSGKPVLTERMDFPVDIPLATAGVYALVYANRIVYVGKSVNVLARISKHRSRYHRWLRGKRQGLEDEVLVVKFDRAMVRFCPEGQLDILEYALINKYRPECNTRLKEALDLPKVDLAALGLMDKKWTQPLKPSSRPFVRRV